MSLKTIITDKQVVEKLCYQTKKNLRLSVEDYFLLTDSWFLSHWWTSKKDKTLNLKVLKKL